MHLPQRVSSLKSPGAKTRTTTWMGCTTANVQEYASAHATIHVLMVASPNLSPYTSDVKSARSVNASATDQAMACRQR